MGAHAHKPTDELRIQIKTLKSFGIRDQDIANYMSISIDTLTKYYKNELTHGRIYANAEVARSLFLNATEHMNVTAQIFWLKTQAKWRTEDAIQEENNEHIKQEILALHKQLDEKYRRDY